MALSNCDGETVTSLLDYFYTGKLGSGPEPPSTKLIELGLKYQITSLVGLCELDIVPKLTIENVGEYLVYGVQNSLETLVNGCHAYIKR